MSAKNWAIVPDNWRFKEPEGGAPSGQAPAFLETNPADMYLGHPTIRLEPATYLDTSLSREYWVTDFTAPCWTIFIKPRDRIVFKVWMKVEPSTVGCGVGDRVNDLAAGTGIRLGADLRHAVVSGNSCQSAIITGLQTLDGRGYTVEDPLVAGKEKAFVNWGGGWQLRVMDFVVQDSYPCWSGAGYRGTKPDGTPIPVVDSRDDLGYEYVNNMTPWIQVWCNHHGQGNIPDNQWEYAKGWFADAELYINPPDLNLTIPLVVLASAAIGLGVSRVI